MACRVSSTVNGPVASMPIPPGWFSFSQYVRFVAVLYKIIGIHPAIIIFSPAFETAATNVGDDIHDIPGRMMGYLHPNREVMRVRTAGAVMVVVAIDYHSSLEKIVNTCIGILEGPSNSSLSPASPLCAIL